jgi:hypothetical protein
MTLRSMFSRGGNGMTSGGLDGYLGPEAQDFSNLPAHIQNIDASSNDDSKCGGINEDEAICQIAAAEKKHQAEQHN